MSMLRHAAFTVSADAEGANGDLDYGQRVDSAALYLVDYVFEALHEHGPDEDGGYGYGTVIDQRVYRAIEQIVAAAMIAQYEHDKESWGEIIAAIVNERQQQQQQHK